MNAPRYTRQSILKGFGPKGQQKLSEARVVVIGAGGLGIPVLTYLNAMGVGTLGIVENDVVSLSNLHRQVLYGTEDVGRQKLSIALEKLKAQNPDTRLVGHETFLTRENAMDLMASYDLVVDASDNFPTRYLINDACVILKKPFVYGALHGYEGQVSVFNHLGGPTYRCLFPSMPGPYEVPNCNEHGVLGIIPGIIGNLQALEAVKVLTGIGNVLSGTLLLFNGLDQSYQKVRFSAVPGNLERTQLEDDYGWEDPCEILPAITAAALLEKIGNSEKVQLIDVRTPGEFGEYHLPQSLNIPLDILPETIHRIDLGKPVYLICQSGQRSETALRLLRNKHREASLFNVLGGMEAFPASTS
jgi:adenylyltransferase/sulfurtransferase